jgi:transcriptional regulator with XRE-family HTH domain
MQPQPEHLAAVGQTVRRARLARGMSQEALADAAGLTYRYIGAIERGERNFSIGVLLAIAHGLELQPSQLLSEIEELLDS